MTLTIAEAKALKGQAVAIDPDNRWEHKRTLHQLARWAGPAQRVVIRDVLPRRPHPSGHGTATTVLVERLDVGGAPGPTHFEVLPRTIAGPWHEFEELRREVEAEATLEARSVQVCAVLGEGFNGSVWEGRHRVIASVASAERVAASLLRARRALREGLAGERNVLETVREAMRWIDEATDADAPTKHRQAIHDLYANASVARRSDGTIEVTLPERGHVPARHGS